MIYCNHSLSLNIKGGFPMTIERLKQVKNVISDVYQGFAGCSTGGCCGVSLPKEDQDKLKQWKQDMQQK